MAALSILQVLAAPFPLHQGSQVYVRGMCEALARQGHRVTLACFAHGRGVDPVGVRVVRARAMPGGSVERSGPHWSRLPQDLALSAVVGRLLRAQRFDVVHAHNVEAPLAVRLASVRVRPPLVYSAHTHMQEELPTYWGGAGVRRLAGWAGGAIDWALPRLADGCVALSPRSEEALRRRCRGPVLYLPPGVHLAELGGGDADRARERWGLDDRPWVVYTGNGDAYQDLPDLYAAMALLPVAGLLCVTGSDPAPIEAGLRRAGVQEARVRVVRSTDFADTLDALAVAALAVIPRRVCAGFPIKLLNSVGLGVPTVVAEGAGRGLPGAIEAVGEGSAALAEALREALLDLTASRRMGERGRLAIESSWTTEVMAERVARFYRNLISPVTSHAPPS